MPIRVGGLFFTKRKRSEKEIGVSNVEARFVLGCGLQLFSEVNPFQQQSMLYFRNLLAPPPVPNLCPLLAIRSDAFACPG